MDISRRSLVAATAAVLAHSKAAAWQGTGAVIDFARAGGSTGNDGERNRRAFVEAILRLHRAGGGTLRVAPGIYPFAGDAAVVANNVSIVAKGATFRGPNCRITIQKGSSRFDIFGLTLVDTAGSRAAFLLNCGGSHCHFKDVHLEKRPAAGGYIGYCQQYTVGNTFENFSFKGSNGIFMGGRSHRVIGGWAEADQGGDDCWVLKAATHTCEDIHISGFRARGFAALFSIGSEVGRRPSDPDRSPLFVRRVTVENCVAEACTYLAYIKPGGVNGGPAYNHRNGLVEDIVLSDCRCEDPAGARFRNGVYVSPGRGATVRRLSIRNLFVRARGGSPAVQTIGAVYLRVLQSSGGPGATIEDVKVDGLRCIDPYAAAPVGPSTPGLPIKSVISIGKQGRARLSSGRIGRVEIQNIEANGCSRSAAAIGPDVEGPVIIRNATVTNFAAAIEAAIDRTPIIAHSPVVLQNVTITPSPLAPAGTRGLSTGLKETRL